MSARSAENLALMLQAVAGHDPTMSQRAVPNYRAGLDGRIERLRLAVAVEGLDTEIDADFATAATRCCFGR